MRVLDAYNSASHCGYLEGNQHPTIEVVPATSRTRTLSSGSSRTSRRSSTSPALISIPYSYVVPAHSVQTNASGTLAVLEAARQDVRRVVHTSTSETYGTAQFQPMDESHPLVAQSPYAATKVAADQLAESYFPSFELPVTTLRPFNTFEPRRTASRARSSTSAWALAAR